VSNFTWDRILAFSVDFCRFSVVVTRWTR